MYEPELARSRAGALTTTSRERQSSLCCDGVEGGRVCPLTCQQMALRVDALNLVKRVMVFVSRCVEPIVKRVMVFVSRCVEPSKACDGVCESMR